MRSRRAILAGVVILAAACSNGGANPSVAAGTKAEDAPAEADGGDLPEQEYENSPFISPQAGEVIESEVPSEHGGEGGPPVDGIEAPISSALEPREDVGGDEPDPPQDPCSLVPTEVFAQWIGDTDVEQHSLEAGDACGYIGGNDTLRLALALKTRSPGSRWLPAEQPVEELEVDGHAAWWAVEHPVPESSVLVVEFAEHELVIEVSSRGQQHAEQFMLDGARRFAEAAIDRHAG